MKGVTNDDWRVSYAARKMAKALETERQTFILAYAAEEWKHRAMRRALHKLACPVDYIIDL